MDFLDALAIITGLLGIASITIGLIKKYSHWKEYTIPLGVGLDGFAFGRVSTIFFSKPGDFPPEYLLIIVISFFVIIGGVFAINYLSKNDDPRLLYFYLCLSLPVLPITFDFFGKIIDRINDNCP